MHTGSRPLIRTPRTEDPGRAAPVGGRRFRPSVRLVTSGSAGTCWFDLACVRVEKRGDVVRCAESGCGGGDGEIGWRDHEELPTGLSCADLMVAPAVGAPFGMVYLEAMACGTPPIATTTDGPARTIKATGTHATGWLVAPDDLAHTRVRLAPAHAFQRTVPRANRQAPEPDNPLSSATAPVTHPHDGPVTSAPRSWRAAWSCTHPHILLTARAPPRWVLPAVDSSSSTGSGMDVP
ncbi:D-inositol-3-phosphate glycosyltransferase [Streptomyces malaysiensis subsp. malaysiensis]|uniref:glycosyltransferase family 4 protein n=1 Tax=Streptomyces malaysiensis TaxID=92644 RepID=UPI000C2BFE28|nr:D-inositol-3-phosphate glycosyltransferase [Streptomyces sp. M56]